MSGTGPPASPPKLFLWISRPLSRQPRIADFKSPPSTSWQGEHHGCIRKNVPWIGTNGICYFGCRDLDIGWRELEGAASVGGLFHSDLRTFSPTSSKPGSNERYQWDNAQTGSTGSKLGQNWVTSSPLLRRGPRRRQGQGSPACHHEPWTMNHGP